MLRIYFLYVYISILIYRYILILCYNMVYYLKGDIRRDLTSTHFGMLVMVINIILFLKNNNINSKYNKKGINTVDLLYTAMFVL